MDHAICMLMVRCFDGQIHFETGLAPVPGFKINLIAFITITLDFTLALTRKMMWLMLFS